MTDFIPAGRAGEDDGPEPLLDAFLREGLPEIKLALGDAIDRDNTRAIPDRYVKMLPVTTLVVTLRPDAARAIAAIAAELEGELTDSVMRHGSLYDREYRVRLREAGQKGAPLFRVAAQAPDAPEPEPISPAPPPGTPPAPERPARAASPPAPEAAGTLLAGRSPEVVDPDATRMDGLALPPFPAGRFALVVEDAEGGVAERFPLTEPVQTVGRATDNEALRSDLQLTGSPNVSRRQLAVVWAGREDEPGFDVYNLGLNSIHVGDREVPGANAGRGALELDGMAAHSIRVAPGESIRIGGHGPVVRIDAGAGADVAPAEGDADEDPDRTRFG
jgi:hypothetical protein